MCESTLKNKHKEYKCTFFKLCGLVLLFWALPEDYFYWFWGGEKQWLIVSHMPPIEDQTHNLCTYPDRELNLKSSGVWDNAPNNWATRSRWNISVLLKEVNNNLKATVSGHNFQVFLITVKDISLNFLLVNISNFQKSIIVQRTPIYTLSRFTNC